MESGAHAGSEESCEIYLRPLDVSDVDDFMEWATDERVTEFVRWEPYTSKDQAIDHIKKVAIPHPYYRAICLKKENRAIGAISVEPKSGEDRCRGELGYVLATKYWGKGIATRAVRLAASTIFNEWAPQLERLEALVHVGNPASERVLEKAGFKREGVLRKYCILKGRTRDIVMFSVLPSDLDGC